MGNISRKIKIFKKNNKILEMKSIVSEIKISPFELRAH